MACGYVADPPATIIYASVVSRKTVAALNGLEDNVSNILNAYLKTKMIEKIWINMRVCEEDVYGSKWITRILCGKVISFVRSHGAIQIRF